MNVVTYDDVDQLNSFLRGELAAVETYEECIAEVTDVPTRLQLNALQYSHARRAAILRNQIISLGGEPAETAGAWGNLTQLIEQSAAAIGPGMAVSVLRRGEDHGLADYKRDIDKLSPLSRRMVEVRILPEQLETQRKLEAIEQTYVER